LKISAGKSFLCPFLAKSGAFADFRPILLKKIAKYFSWLSVFALFDFQVEEILRLNCFMISSHFGF